MKKALWKKAGAVMASLVLLAGVMVLPAGAAALSEDFEGFGSTDDLSMNWFPYGDFITDITLSKTGGVNNSKALKMTLAFEETAKDKWGTLRGSYADDMSSKVATGIRFWAKSDVDGQVIKVIMVYNNMSWKYAAKVTIGKTGQYYEVPFSSMQLDYGTVTVQNGTDPQYINEWQFQPERKAGTDEATIFIDDISYIGDGPTVGPTDPPVTDAPTTPLVNKTDPPTTPPVNGGSTAPADDPATTGDTGDGTTDPTTGTSDVSDAAVGPASNVTTAPDGSSVPPPDETGGLGTGAIVGIVIAAVVVLAGAGAAVYFLVIRKKNPEEPGDPGQESE